MISPREDVPHTLDPPPNGASGHHRVPGEDDVPVKTRLNIRSARELITTVLPPIDWILEPYIERGAVGLMVAAPSVGKTLLALSWAYDCARRGLRVCVVEEEGGLRGLQSRLTRAERAAGGIPDGRGTVDFAFKPSLSLTKAQDLGAMCVELEGYDLIIIDTLARMCAGADENSTEDMGAVVAALTALAKHTGATILALHHTGKSVWKPGQIPTIGDSRGAGALAGAVDFILNLATLKEPPLPGWVAFSLHTTKQRDAECAPAMIHRVIMTGPSADWETEEITPPTIEVKDKIVRDVLAYLAKVPGGTSKAQIERNVRGAKNRIGDAIANLIESGEAVEIPHGEHPLIALPRTSPNLPESPRGDPSPTSPPYVVGGEPGTGGGGARRGGEGGRHRNWTDAERDDDA